MRGCKELGRKWRKEGEKGRSERRKLRGEKLGIRAVLNRQKIVPTQGCKLGHGKAWAKFTHTNAESNHMQRSQIWAQGH